MPSGPRALNRTPRLEPHDSVAHDLQTRVTDPGSLATAKTIGDRGQRQGPPDLSAIFAMRRKPSPSTSERKPIAAAIASQI